jgi:hypothetical protein
MLRRRREPADFARQAERHPQLPAHLRDFYIPQRGIFAVGRVFVTRVPAEAPAAELAAEVLR